MTLKAFARAVRDAARNGSTSAAWSATRIRSSGTPNASSRCAGGRAGRDHPVGVARQPAVQRELPAGQHRVDLRRALGEDHVRPAVAPAPRQRPQRRRPVLPDHHAVGVGPAQRALEPTRQHHRRAPGAPALPRPQVHRRVRVLAREPVRRHVPARLAGRLVDHADVEVGPLVQRAEQRLAVGHGRGRDDGAAHARRLRGPAASGPDAPACGQRAHSPPGPPRGELPDSGHL